MWGLNRVIANAKKAIEGIRNTGPNIVNPLFQKWAPKWFGNRFLRKQNDTTLSQAEIQAVENIAGASLLFFVFLAQWLFWAGFVRASRER
jgi:hypothetical protein